MKTKNFYLYEIKVSPNTEVSCEIGDSPTLIISGFFDLERTPEYEVKSVLITPNNNTSCTLILKEAMTDENKV